MKALSHILDELLPALAFLVYVLVEAAVVYGLLKWTGAV
jgi:hypothetical protein